MKLTAPETWVRKAPRFSFTLAEFSLPRAEGDSADGRLTVMLAWGGVEANVARWRQQFGDKLEEESQEELDIGDITGTLVDFSGQYAGQTGMFPSSGQQSSYRMLGAIFPVGSQLAFIKLTGPQKTVAVHADEFLAFVRSVKPHGSDASDQLSEPDETDASRTR